MVFESIVVDILNKYLGKYFENLDPSQLKLGIWGGDVVLENLRIQSNAVKEFNVPFQIAFGFLGKLTLKIPWKNLYKEPVVATVDGLYLLLVPDDDDTYDEAAELKLESDAKQEKLKEIMELESKQASGKEESQDGFVEKLTSQIIRNVQIRIQNIHMRYEDQSTNTQHPFAAGVKLKNLHFETTDENWIPTLLDAPVENIYKLVDLQGLSLYWNASPKDYYKDFPPSEQLSLFKQSFGDKDLSTEYTYILKPIQLKARLKLDPKANVNLQPKIFITLVIEEVGFQLSHQQYHGIVVATDNIDRMSINARFRKFKPTGPLTPAKWWIYAYRSVVGTIVANSRKLCWLNIKKHRDNVHQYKALYKQKLEEKTPNQILLDQLLKAEDALDIFNITLTRKQAEIELVREGSEILNAEYLQQHNKQSSSGWFSGWFSSKSSKPEKPKEPKGLDSVMTGAEKKELYQSIGYIEGELLDDSDLPKPYVKTHLTVSLKKVSLELCNKNVCAEDILKLCFYGINLVVKQRPSAKAVRITGDLQSLAMYGVPQNNQTPTIVAHDIDSTTKQSLFHFDFETNPLDETCDQRIVADSKPVTMVYDEVTVNNLTTFFKPPENTRLQRLRTVAASTYNDVKNQTTTGLKHIIKNKQITQINVHFSSSRFVLPKDGTVQSNSHALVLDLGELIVINDSCFDEKSVDNRGVAEIQLRIYDAFNINVKNIQLVLSRKGEEPTSSNLHILEPINISLYAEKCLVENDSSLPVIKVTGSLPSVALKLSDLKLLQIIQLVESIPLPPEQPISDVDEIEVESWPAAMTDTDDVTLVEKTISKHFDESIVLQQSNVHSSSDEEFFSAESE
ncbi:intermembrane lipid transfer protein VPS13A-like [Ciona intestinalis]